MQHPDEWPRKVGAFEIYLRTGRRAIRGVVERKFNPWHDPEDGRFTFVGAGNYVGGQNTAAGEHARKPSNDESRAGGGSSGGGGASGSWGSDPDDVQNHSLYTVQRGDTLTSIARMRKGLAVSDLAWLNGLPLDRPLRIGQRLKLPHQRFLDAGRDAKNKYLALAYYMRTHGGQLPPNSANPPSLESQILDRNWRQEIRAGYNFYIDAGSRFRLLFGSVTLAEAPARSRKSQREVPERGPRDDGGHYVAPRFNGPTDWFNHFAQDLHINRGTYRVMEDKWYKAAAAGKKVFINIKPLYPGASRRPSRIWVTWYVDGRKHSQEFPNEPTGEGNGKR